MTIQNYKRITIFIVFHKLFIRVNSFHTVKRETFFLVLILASVGVASISSYPEPHTTEIVIIPNSAEDPVMPTENILEQLTIEVNAYIVTFPSDSISSSRDEESVVGLFERANQIWEQGKIEFTLDNVEILELGENLESYNIGALNSYLVQSENYDPNKINAFFIREIGANGRAYYPRVVMVADKTSVLEYRTLAHEFGHILGLGHVPPHSRLMAAGRNGMELSEEEIDTARTNANFFR